jgi:hypothetical protein
MNPAFSPPLPDGKLFPPALALALPLAAFFFSPLAFGQWNRSDLNSAVSGGGVVTVPGGVDFANTDHAVQIPNSQTTLRGAANGLAGDIWSLTADILGQVNGQREGATASLIPLISNPVNAFAVPGGMRYIQGDGTPRSITDTSGNGTSLDEKKWLLIPVGSATGANLGLQYLHFRDVGVQYNYHVDGSGGVVNGLIGGAFNITTSSVSLGNLIGNAFTDVGVTMDAYRDDQYLAGGGIIGVRSTAASASMGNILGNVFRGVSVTAQQHSSSYSITGGTKGSAYIEGGGVIGVDAVSSPAGNSGHASIESLDYNLFTDIDVVSGDIILGGGVIGVNNNSQSHDDSTYSRILAVTGNIFGNGTLDKTNAATAASTADIYVHAGYSLRGGGVIGVNGLSNASVELGGLAENIFAGIYVDTDSYLKGGGIVGVQSNDGGDGKSDLDPGTMYSMSAYLGDVRDNLFFNQRVDVGTYLSGGGVIGIRSNAGLVALNNLEGNIFKGLTVNVGNVGSSTNNSAYYLDGGGVIGASALAEAAITQVKGNYFEDLQVTVKKTGTGSGSYNGLRGGGVIGASASDGSASGSLGVAEVNEVIDNIFRGITVNVESSDSNSAILGHLSGGGVVGANSAVKSSPTAEYHALIPNLTGNIFYDINISATGNILGGGVVGAHTEYQNGTGVGTAGSVNLSNNTFRRVTVNASNIYGGGIVGFYAEGANNAYMGTVSGNQFYDGSSVITTGAITGGGALGVYSPSGIAWIDEIIGNDFLYMDISAGTHIDGGGIIGATGAVGTTSAPEQFIGIDLIDKSNFVGNTVRASNGQIMGGAVYSYGSFLGMTIRDSIFRDNTFYSTCGSSCGSAGAKVYGTVTVDTGLAGPGADTIPNTLTLEATAGNNTWFENNRISEDGGTTFRTNSLYFGTVLDAANSYAVDDADSDAHLIIRPDKDGIVALIDPIEVNQDNASGTDRKFAMTVWGAGEFLWGGKNVFAVGDSYSGSYAVDNEVIFKSGSATTLLSGMTLEAVAHAIELEAGGRVTIQGKNAWSINTAALKGRLHFNLGAATVNDSSITPLLKIDNGVNTDTGYANIMGATVSLSNFAAGPALSPGDEFYLIDTEAVGDLIGDPANNTAYARQGMTRGYNFVIDKNPTQNTLSGTQNRMLVARLVSAPMPARETRILTEGRVASLALLGQNANWLADHSYQQADLALRRGENRAFFGGADYADARLDTGSTVDYRGYTLIVGEARKREKEDQSFLLGGFFEAGYGDYDIHGKFGHPDHPNMKGDGKLRYYGLGLMARQKWDSGLRLEGSLRGGRQENKFRSRDLADVDGTIAKYTLRVPWLGAHLGVGHEWQKDEHTLFDLYLRYYWTYQDGKRARLNNDKETVRFYADESQRARLGGRYTRIRDAHRSWYLGLAYEREFDHRAKARSLDGIIEVPDPRGEGFIGEIGMILHPQNHNRLSLEFGLQGYTGYREGVSGGFRLGWKF